MIDAYGGYVEVGYAHLDDIEVPAAVTTTSVCPTRAAISTCSRTRCG